MIRRFPMNNSCLDSSNIKILLTSCSGRNGSRWNLPSLTVPSNGRNLLPLATYCSVCTAKRQASPSWLKCPGFGVGAKPNSVGISTKVSILSKMSRNIWLWIQNLRCCNVYILDNQHSHTIKNGYKVCKLQQEFKIDFVYMYINSNSEKFGISQIDLTLLIFNVSAEAALHTLHWSSDLTK
jgi:hypothetical protein